MSPETQMCVISCGSVAASFGLLSENSRSCRFFISTLHPSKIRRREVSSPSMPTIGFICSLTHSQPLIRSALHFVNLTPLSAKSSATFFPVSFVRDHRSGGANVASIFSSPVISTIFFAASPAIRFGSCSSRYTYSCPASSTAIHKTAHISSP